jgi:phage-related protein
MNTSGFNSGLREMETGLAGMSTKITGFGKDLMGIGGKLSLGLTLPIAVGAKVVFDAASDMQESMGKVKVVFGESTDAIVKWSKDSAQSLGLSQQAALEAAGSYGNLFQAFGLGKTESKDMSTSLVGLAADLASFNNTSTDDALLALRSGLSGEAEPLKKFGIALSDVRLKEEAMSLGLIKSTKDALNPAAKAQASYSLIMKDSKLAQGDFARTADGAANKQRILSAEFQNAKAAIGEGLLPVATKLFGVVGDLISGFNGLSPQMRNIILIGAGVAAAIGPILTVAGALVTGFGLLLTPVGLVIGGIALVAAGFVYLYKTSEPVRKAVDGLVAAFKDFDLDNIGASLKNVGANLSTVLTEGLGALTEAIGNIDWAKVTSQILDALQKLKDVIFEFLGGIDWGGLVLEAGRLLATAFGSLGKLLTEIDWKKVFAFILDLGVDILKLIAKIDWGKVAAGIGTALVAALKLVFIDLPKGLIEMVVGLFSAVGDLLTGDVDWGEVAAKVGTALLSLFELVFIELPSKLFEVVWEGLKAAWEFIKDVDWGEVATQIGEAYLTLMKLIWIELPKKIFELAWKGIKAAWEFLKDVDWAEVGKTVGEAFLKLIKLIWIDLPSKIGEVVGKGIKAAFKWAVENGGDLLSSLTDFIKKIPGKIVDTLGDLGKTLYEKGKDLIQGLLDGAGSLLKKIGEFFLDKVPSWIKGAFKSALGISSPSKVFKEYGKNIMEGFAIGLDDITPIDRAMRKMANAATLNIGTSAGAPVAAANIQYITVEAQMLVPTPEAGRVISQSLKEYNVYDGRG